MLSPELLWCFKDSLVLKSCKGFSYFKFSLHVLTACVVHTHAWMSLCMCRDQKTTSESHFSFTPTPRIKTARSGRKQPDLLSHLTTFIVQRILISYFLWNVQPDYEYIYSHICSVQHHLNTSINVNPPSSTFSLIQSKNFFLRKVILLQSKPCHFIFQGHMYAMTMHCASPLTETVSYSQSINSWTWGHRVPICL